MRTNQRKLIKNILNSDLTGINIELISVVQQRHNVEKPLTPSAQRVQDALAALGYTLKVMESETDTRTAQEAADAVGCTLGQIVKSLVFRTRSSARPILVLTSGVNRVSETRIATYLEEPVGRADPDFVREATGFAIGGIPPLGHPRRLTTFIDEDLMIYETIWAAAGTPHAVFQLTPQQLYEITSGTLVRVK